MRCHIIFIVLDELPLTASIGVGGGGGGVVMVHPVLYFYDEDMEIP